MTDRAGMTLIELTLALTLLAVVVTGGYQLYGTARTIGDQVDGSLTALSREATIRTTISSWLRHPVMRTGQGGFYAFDQTWQGIEDDRLRLWVRSPIPGVAGVARLDLFVDREQATAEEGLVASVVPLSDGRAVTVTLASDVGRFDLRFRAPDVEEELSSWQSRSLTPRSVSIEMGPRPGLELPPLQSTPWIVAVGEVR